LGVEVTVYIPPEISADTNPAAGLPEAGSFPPPPAPAEEAMEAERRAALRAAVAATLRMTAGELRDDAPLTAYGLDSLGAIEVQSRLQADLGLEISVAELLGGISLADLAAAEAHAAPAAAVPEAEGPETGRFPLAANQQALWFLHQLAPQSLAYHLAGAARFSGPIDRPALGRALAALVERHPALRTTFHEDGDGPWQEVAERAPFELLELDAGDGPDDGQALEETEVARVERLRAAAFRPFDLARGPLWRVGVLGPGGARFGGALSGGALSGGGRSGGGTGEGGLLFFAIHHLVADFWSLQVLVRDLAVLYARESAAAAGAAPAALPRLELRTTDFVRWQGQRLAGPTGERLWRYWREALAGEPPRLDLPTDRPWPPLQTWGGGALTFELPEALVARLEGVARARGATLFMVLLAGVQALLGRLAGGTRIVVGSPTHGRDGRAGATVADLVGYFVNLVPLAADLAGDPTFTGMVTAARVAALAAIAHREMPLALLAERLLPARDPARSPLFDVLFAFDKGREARLDLGGFALGMPGSRLRLGGAVLSSLPFAPAGAPFALSLLLAELGRGLGASLQFNNDLFDRSTAARLSGQLCRLLEGAAREPGQRLSELPLLSAAEAHQVVAEWNDAAAVYPGAGRCLHELIAEQATRRPQAPAVVAPEGCLSYGELAAAAGRLARELRGLGVGADRTVAVCAERSLEMIVGLLAVLAAGGAYVPLDPDFPRERLAFMLADCEAAVLLVQRRLCERLGPLPAGLTVEHLDGAAGLRRGGAGDAAGVESATLAPLPGDPAALAYVIYTSGSTGRPKGAMNAHRAVVNRLLWAQQTYGLTAADRVLQKTPISFDVSVWELFWPLTAGATLVLARPGGHQDPAYLARLIAEQRITTLHFVPSMLHAFLDGPGGPGATATAVRQVFTSGEALAGELARRCQARFAGAALHNLYGPTEAAVEVTAWRCEPAARRPAVPIGRPIGNARIHLLDAALRPVPIGVAGELYIGGLPPARGYFRRPELTAERFVPDPFGGSFAAPGARLYRSGDLARLLAGGAVDFLGRIDGQVKLRGVRIELGEIEELLATHSAVRQAAAGVVEIAPEDRRLVAWIVPAEAAAPPAEGELRGFLRQRLPEAMVPAAFVTLTELPRNPSGKLDRRALPAPRWGRGEDGAFVAPRTPAEQVLAGIWCEVLGSEHVGVHDSFFALGGHSLLAARLMSRVRRAFGVELPLAALFTAPTVAELAARIESQGAALGPATEPILPRPRPELPPLSYAQERLWFLDQLEPGSVTYNVPAALRLRGELAWAPLAGALAGIVARHEALRTRFPEAAGQPLQRVEPPAPVPLPVVDLAGLGGAAANAEALRLAAAEAATPFDLARGPLLRARLLALGAPGDGGPGRPDAAPPPAGREWLLLVSFHHIVFDGASVEVLWRELGTLYGALLAGHPSPLALLPPLPIQYLDYALWQRRRLDGPALGPLLAAWRQALAGAPQALELPVDRPRPPVRGSRGGRRLLRLGPDAAGAVAALARAEDATSFMVLLAAFAALLGRAGGGDADAGGAGVVVGSPVANRDRLELEPLIGFFVNALPLHVDLTGDPAFGELLARARRVALAACALQELPFEKLVEELAPERDPSRTPLFQVMLGFRDRQAAQPGLPGIDAELLPSLLRRAKFDLVLSLESGAHGLAGDLEYSAELFDAATAERLAGRFGRLLAAAVREPERRLSELPLLGEAERHQLLWAWNDTSWDYPREMTLAAAFAAAVARAPDAVALVMDAAPGAAPGGAFASAPAAAGGGAAGVTLTYGALDRAANRLARHLLGLGVRAEDRIALCLPRSPELIVAVLACVKAGGAYVPLDPAYPAERLAWMLADCGAAAVVSAGALVALPAAAAGGLLHVDLVRDRQEIERARAAPPPADAQAGAARLACLIYTSGSTGTPKGVALVQRGVVRLALGGGHARLGPDRVLAHLAPITFDAATFEIWCALANGSRLVILPPGVPSLDELGAALARHQVTTLFLTTALFHEMVEENLGGLAPVEELFTGGDVVSLPHLLRAAGELPRTRLFDAYGPAEDTTYATCWPVRPHAAGGSPPIGRPIAGTEAYVLDRQGQLLPQGSAGELALGGDGLARGYWDRPAFTAERFRPHPFSRRPGERLYLTGDRVRHLADGNLRFLGRVDRQVKIRGFRVEPGEIEAALAAHPGVAASVVVVREDRPGDKRLVAYVAAREAGDTDPAQGASAARAATPEGAAGAGPAASAAPGPAASAALDPAELRRHLASSLPAHLLPASIVVLAALPVTAHGKIDRRALPAPAPEAEDGAFVAPRTAAEELVAGIWREVLGVERLGVHDNFFELGGHSLLAARSMLRLRRAVGGELPLAALFEAPTVAGLAARLELAGRAGPAPAPIAPRPRLERLPLSFAQERLWFLDQLDPGGAAYNIGSATCLTGPLATDALAAALAEIVRRHEALRTVFTVVDGAPVQRILPPPVAGAAATARGAPLLPVVDLRALPAAARGTQARLLAAAFGRRGFDLARGPLLRTVLLRLAGDEHHLLLCLHHAVADGWSMPVLARELEALYDDAHGGGQPSPRPAGSAATGGSRGLPELPIQYADYACWQRERLQGEALAGLLGYWCGQLAGAAELDLPTDRPLPPERGTRGASRPLALPAPLAGAVAALARTRQATPFMVLLAAFQALLARTTGQDDVVVGSPVANRHHQEVANLIGCFVNTLPLRTDLAGDPSAEELLGRVRKVALAAYAHQELPFERLVEELRRQRAAGAPGSRAEPEAAPPGGGPLPFRVLLAFQEEPPVAARLRGLAVATRPIESGTAKFDLTLTLFSRPGRTATDPPSARHGPAPPAAGGRAPSDAGAQAPGLHGWIELSTELFDAATVLRLAAHFATLLAGMTGDPGRRLSELPLLPEAEREQVLRQWSRTAGSYRRDVRLHELFAEQVARAPEAPALAWPGQTLTYGQLAARSRRVARTLRALGVGPEVRVGLLAERTPELVVGLLAVLEAGGAFVPLDPGYPPQRQAWLLADSGAVALLAREEPPAPLAAAVPRVVLLVGRGEEEDTPAPEPPAAPRVPADALAWLVYTSGSTGRPKGVAVSHASAVPLLLWSIEYFGLGAGTRVLQGLSPAFDFGVLEILSTLLAGGVLHLAADELADPQGWAATARELGIDCIHTTPSFFREAAAAGVRLDTARILHLGGEALYRGEAERLLAAVAESAVLYNGYGPTEVTVNSLIYAARRPGAWPAGEAVPIGRPSGERAAYVLDRAGEPVPPGVPGELFLGGRGVARGYHGRPELTAERFVPDPFGGEAGARLYRSGDLVRWLPDGNVEFLGRTDQQIKVRGFRVELGEIEAVLAEHPRVREAVVLARPGAPARAPADAGGGAAAGHDLRLVAYVAGGPPAERPDPGELRAFLARRLPAHMVPAIFVTLDSLPRTPIGKVDRRALPEPPALPEAGAADGRSAAGDRRAAGAPRSPLEEMVAGIVAGVLGVARVGPDDDFFALGGHSLLATRLVSQLREVLQVQLPLRQLFQTPTAAGLAAAVARRRQAAASAGAGPAGAPAGEAAALEEPPIVRVPRDGRPLPLSFAQQRLWFLDKLQPGSAAFNLPVALRLAGDLDPARLRRALAGCVRRHEALRTTFGAVAGEPFQRIAPEETAERLPLPRLDLSRLPAPARNAELRRVLAAEATTPFDLEHGPLLRSALCKLAPAEWVLLLDCHHIVTDGWSLQVLMRDLGRLYAAAAAGPAQPPPELPALPVQYADFASWQQRWLAGEARERLLAYWRRQLGGTLPVLDLPTDRLRPPVQTFAGRSEKAVLPADLADELRALGHRRGATLFMTLFAAWNVLLHRYSGQHDLPIGIPIAGRNRAAVEQLVGMFVNSLVLRTDLGGNPSFDELLARVRQVAIDAFTYQDLPFELLLQELRPERDLSRTPLFQVYFNFQSWPEDTLTLPGLSVSSLTGVEEFSKFDLTLYLVDEPGGPVGLDLVFNTCLFGAPRIAEMLAQYAGLLRQAAARPAAGIDELSLVTAGARALLPDPAAPLDAGWIGPVHGFLAAWAARDPEQPAVAFGEASFSYGELEARSNRLAHWLRREAGVAPRRGDEAVAIYAHRSATLAWAVLGTLKAGGAFVLLDPAYPPARIAEMLRLAQPRAWLQLAAAGPLPAALEELVASLPACCRLVLPPWQALAAGAPDPLAGEPASDPGVEVGPDDLACIGFTSGSTGVPKGILGRHGPLSHFLPWQCGRLGLTGDDRFSLLSGLAHDPLQRDLFTPLFLGATLAIPDAAEIAAPGPLAAWMRRQRVSVAHLTPAMGQLLAEAAAPGAAMLDDLRRVLLVGDVLTRRDVARLRRLAPGAACVNLYGSTETQRAVGFHVAGDEPAAGEQRGREILPLGRGMKDVQLLVLRRGSSEPAPAAERAAAPWRLAGIGELGEIAVRSPHLAAGYLGDPEATAARFLTNPATGTPGDRLYLTGDLGRYLPDGEVAFAGRADTQVKIRGFRIELGEIEAHLGRLPGVREAVVLPTGEAADRRLVAYVVPEPVVGAGAASAPPVLDVGELRRHLKQALPAYMVPSGWVLLPRMPLTANGKIDRRALAGLEAARPPAGDGGHRAPQTRAEARIAAIVREVLGVERLGVDDNFFDLGGNSLLLVKLQSRLQVAFERPLPVLELFSNPTVASLARHLVPAAAEASVIQEDGAEKLKLGKDRLRRRFQQHQEAAAAGGPARRSR
jgi:amino acid adenylation domain-containing protein